MWCDKLWAAVSYRHINDIDHVFSPGHPLLLLIRVAPPKCPFKFKHKRGWLKIIDSVFMRSIRIIGDSITPGQKFQPSRRTFTPSMLQRHQNSDFFFFFKHILFHYPRLRLTIFRREFVIGVLVDVVPSDSDIDAVGERPVPLHVSFVSID